LNVATATADIGNLRFYQRVGFRMRTIERDAFTRIAGYPAELIVDGIPLRDRAWLDLQLDPAPVMTIAGLNLTCNRPGGSPAIARYRRRWCVSADGGAATSLRSRAGSP